MPVFRCESCGAGLEVQEGSKIAYCPYCGMKQTLPEGSAKILRAGAKIENMLKRGFMLLEDGEFKKADKYFDRALDAEPGNGHAHLGKLMVSLGSRDVKNLAAALKESKFVGRLVRRVLDFQPELIRDMFSEDYNRAVALMNEEKYSEAIQIFDSIKNYYHEASGKAEQIRQIFRPKADEVITLINKGDKYKASAKFKEIACFFSEKYGGFEEIRARLQPKCNEAIVLMNDGEYLDALDIFSALRECFWGSEYIRSLSYAEDICCQKLCARRDLTYIEARALMDKGKYEEAANLFDIVEEIQCFFSSYYSRNYSNEICSEAGYYAEGCREKLKQ